MSINISRLLIQKEKQDAAEALAKQMAKEQSEENLFQGILQYAAPIAASVLLPGIGTASMGLLGGGALGSLGTAAAGAIGGKTLTGGLLAGLGKAAGQYAISEGLEGAGRFLGAGGDVEDIDISNYTFGQKSQREARKSLEDLMDIDKGQIGVSIIDGLKTTQDFLGGKEALIDEISKLFNLNKNSTVDENINQLFYPNANNISDNLLT